MEGHLSRKQGEFVEKLNRLRVAEKEREALSSAKAEAEAYVVAEDKIRRQRNTLYQVLRREAAANVALVGERHDELAGRLAEERAKRAAIETSLSGDKAEVAALTKEHAAAAKAAEKAAAKASDGERREAKKHQEAAARKLEHAAKKDAAVAEEKEGFVAEQERDELPRLNKKVATMSTKADEAEAAREVCKAETTAAQKVLEAKTQADLAPVQEKLSEALSALREVQDELDLTLDGSTAAAKELEAVEAKLGKLEAQAGAKGEELEIHRAKVEA